MAANRSGSILAADFGSVYTRAMLIDVVDGMYRLVARGESRTTSGYPIEDVSVGLDRALTQLSEITGRKLVGDNGRIITPEKADRSGADFFVATASVGRPLQTVMVGLVPDVSIASGLRAASGTYIAVAETISLYDGRTEEERLNAILLSRPDLIFITGGTDRGARDAVLELARVARLAVLLTDAKHKPLVVYAGNRQLHADVQKMFEDAADVLIADNVRPSLEAEQLDPAQIQLGRAFDEYKEKRGEGFQNVSSQSVVGVLPTAQSYSWIAEYLSKLEPDKTVLAVDIGSAVGIASAAEDGEVSTSIRTDIGLGHSAYHLLQSVGYEAIRQWIPFVVTPNEVVNYALNKSLRPSTVPMTVREMYLEHALLRAGLQKMVADMSMEEGRYTSNVGTIIASGSGLTRTGSKGFTALLLLDALQPEGITALYADTVGLIPALGAMSLVSPGAVVQLLEGHDLERLGTAISVSGTVRPGKPALKLRFIVDKEKFDHEIEGGHLWVLPLAAGKKIEVQIRVRQRGLDIGGKTRLRLTLEGGSAGLIFDVRGRPLPIATDPAGRAAQFPMWISEVTGDSLIPIDERWLVDLSAGENGAAPAKGKKRAEEAAAPKPAKERRGLFGRRKKAAAPAAQAADEDEAFLKLLEEEQEEDEFASLRGELTKK